MAKKRDEGHEETEKVLTDIEKEISKEYAQAEKEISEKLDDYLRRFEKKDEIKYNAWQEGKITKEEYEQWRVGQIAVGKQWEAMKNTLADDYANAAQIAKSITDGHMPEVYSINHAYGTYQVEKVAGVDTKYIHNTMYDRQSVEHLFKGKGKLYHDYGIKTGIAIAEGKQKAWDRKQIQSVMTQSLLQGESIGKIATRLSKTVGDSDRKACIRNARTMATGVQNAGRTDSYKRAQGMGIKLEQEWLATLDSRTRHEHRMLDGQRVKVGEKFKVDGYELAFPADPEGEAFLVYNCRCTLVPALEGFAPEADDLSLRNTNHMDEETYEEWKESHNITSDPITKQDDIEQNMKRVYNNEYRKLQGKSPAHYASEAKGASGDVKGYAEDTFDRKITKGTVDEDLKKTNPNYVAGRNGVYENNCQRCVPSFLLRRQGFDVVAQPEWYGKNEGVEKILKKTPNHIYRRKDGSIPQMRNTNSSTTFGRAEIEAYMADLKDGAMCEIKCTWANKEDEVNNGHVFIAEKKDGKIRYIDPQNGEEDVSRYFEKMKERMTYFWRIDDTTIDDEYLPYIATNKGGGQIG